MKCVCGYEYKDNKKRLENWQPLEEKIAAGEAPFIPIETQILIPTSALYGGIKDASLYICPKCGAVRAEL